MNNQILSTIQTLLTNGHSADEAILFLSIQSMEEENSSPVMTSAKKLSSLLYGNEKKTSTVSRCLNSLIKQGILYSKKSGNHYYYSTHFINETQCTHDVRPNNIIYINTINTIKDNDNLKRTQVNYTEIILDQLKHYKHYTGTAITISTRYGKRIITREQIIEIANMLTNEDIELISRRLSKKSNCNKTYITSAIFLHGINKLLKNKKSENIDSRKKAKELIHYDECMNYAHYNQKVFDLALKAVSQIIETPDNEMVYLSSEKIVPAKTVKQDICELNMNELLYCYRKIELEDIACPEKYILTMLCNAKRDYNTFVIQRPNVPVPQLASQERYDALTSAYEKMLTRRIRKKQPHKICQEQLPLAYMAVN